MLLRRFRVVEKHESDEKSVSFVRRNARKIQY